ncbi:MAG: VWA domain-containing protein [Myxococcales bacterium]|nr:VWA domain-containing protein [Myxococcales bacterium]
MGYGGYDLEAHQAATKAREALPKEAIFTQGACHADMSPAFMKPRESRDSPLHPSSVGVVFALDVSGSMGAIPHQMATRTLPTFMKCVTAVIPDPQILFIAFGNAWADRSPIQVGQFESEAALIDRWLGLIHLEGGGGGVGESYEIAMWVAAHHTKMDCFEKRKKKGYYFMTGDERTFGTLNAAQVQSLFRETIPTDRTTNEVAEALLETFHVFMLIPDPSHIEDAGCVAFWQHFLRERVIVVPNPEDMAVVAATLIGIQEGQLRSDADISAFLESRLGRIGAERDRILSVVSPYAAAVAAGPLSPLGLLGPPQPFPAFKG